MRGSNSVPETMLSLHWKKAFSHSVPTPSWICRTGAPKEINDMFFWDSRFLVEFFIGNMYKNGYGSKLTPQNGWLRFRNWRPQMIGLLLVHRTQNDRITQLTFRKKTTSIRQFWWISNRKTITLSMGYGTPRSPQLLMVSPRFQTYHNPKIS